MRLFSSLCLIDLLLFSCSLQFTIFLLLVCWNCLSGRIRICLHIHHLRMIATSRGLVLSCLKFYFGSLPVTEPTRRTNG